VDEPIVVAHLAAGGMAVAQETLASNADLVLHQAGVRLAALSPATLRLPERRRRRTRFAAAMVLAMQFVPHVVATGNPR
jgi:hypothetical protein